MTRVRVFAALSCAAMMLFVTNVNAQCASCGQNPTPAFSQGYGQNVTFVANPSYSQPVYAQPQVSYAQPISNGCSSCGQNNFVTQPVSVGCNNCAQGTYVSMSPAQSSGCGCSGASAAYSYAQPVNGCSSCGSAVNYAQPVSNYSVPVNTGCSSCCANDTVRPLRLNRVRVLGQRRSNNCNTCDTCNGCY